MADSFNRSGASPPKTKVVEPTYEGDFVLDGSLPLECGRHLICPTLHYAVYGRLNAARDKILSEFSGEIEFSEPELRSDLPRRGC